MYCKSDFEDDFDRNQEISRSAFADMLHDTERNQRYSSAIKEAIELTKTTGKKANVLEIGTGSGLLSMLAAKHGADSVSTIEAFGPVSEIAAKLIEINGFKEKINVIQKHSTKVVLGVDLKQKGNILVTELFDTELIGEGAIKAYNHAHKNLMEEDCLAVPTSASVYVLVVESPVVNSWLNPKIIADLDGDVLLVPPEDIKNCSGSPSIHDIQLSQLPLHSFRSLTKPTKICDFDFTGKSEIPENFREAFTMKSEISAFPQAIFFYWELKMNPSGSNLLSCAPYWCHPETEKLLKENPGKKPESLIPWRDHWMQGIYYLNKKFFLNENQNFTFTAYHDEFSWWFDVGLQDDLKEQPACDCLFHSVNSRSRVAEMNDSLRTKQFMKLFDRLEMKGKEILVLGDNSLIGMGLAKLGVKNLHILEENSTARRVTLKFIEHNKFQNVKVLENLESPLSEISLIFSEPYFLEADLPWDNITELLKRLQIVKKSNPNVKVIPQKAQIFAVPVHFLDLYKIRHPLGKVEGFDHQIFDDYVENAMQIADRNVERTALWEYPCKVLGEKSCIFEIDFNNFDEKISIQTNLDVKSSKDTCNGLAMWMNWHLDNKLILNGGLLEEPQIDSIMQWSLSSRQGFHLIPAKEYKDTNLKRIQTTVSLSPDLLQIFMNFTYEK